jgi:hypothetical protein
LKKFLRGYDVDTGKVLWEVEKDFEAFQIMATSNQPSQQNLVFITGRAVNATGIATGDIFVRAYQARNADVATSLLLE